MDISLYILNPVLLAVIGFGIISKPGLQSIKKHLLPALGLRLLVGILLGLLYHHYYGEGDTLTFEKASLALTNYAKQHPVPYLRLILFNAFESEAFRASIPFSTFPNFSNSFYFIKLLSLLNLLTNSNYYFNALYLSLFSFWGAATLTATLTKYFPKYKLPAVMAFLYFPSVVFWSSGVLKDALLFGSMCWVVSGAIELAEGRRLSLTRWLLLPVMLYVFVRIKFFLGLMLLPLLVLYVLIRFLGYKTKYLKQTRRQKIALVTSYSLVCLFGLYQVLQFNNAFFLQNLVDTYEGMLQLSQGRPHIAFASLQPTVGSIALNAPEAWLSAVYRPFVWEAVNIFYLLMGIENLFILILSVLGIFSLFKNGIKDFSLLQLSFILLVLSFGVIIGLTTPNFGTLSRYRIAFLPFLVLLLLQNRYVLNLLGKLKPLPFAGADL